MEQIGNTGIEWSNPQVWGSVAPLIQQYAKDYNDRADEHNKLKISLQQQAERAKQAEALAAQKALVKQQADTEKSMAAFGIKPQNYFPEDIPIIAKSMDDLKVAAGQYRMKTGKSPLESYDPEALKIQTDFRNHQLLEAQAASHADNWNKIDRSNIDPDQEDELLTQRAAYAMSVNPNMTRDEALALQRQPFGYKTVAPLPELERLDLAKEVTETAKNHVKKTGEEKNLTGTLLKGTKDEVIDTENAANAVLLDWTNSPTKMLDLSTRPEFAKTDSQGNPIYQLDEQGRPIQQKMKVKGEGVKVLPLYEIDKNKVMSSIKSLMPTTSLHETKEIKSKPSNIIVNNNSGSESGGSWSKGKNASSIPLIIKPVTSPTPRLLGGTMGKNMSIAQINSSIGAKTTLGNNTIVINPNTSGAKSNIKLVPQMFNNAGILRAAPPEELKQVVNQEALFDSTPQIEYFPVNISGNIVQNQDGEDRFSILKDDRVIVGAAPFIKARVKIKRNVEEKGKQVGKEFDEDIYIPASSLDAEIPQWLDRPWLEQKGYGINVTEAKENPKFK